jgi:F-type H+-transporting ATPase subunit delta
MTHHAAKEPAVTADVSALRIARVYAAALLNAAAKTGAVPMVLEELDSLVEDVFAKQPQLEVLFSSAAIGRHVRQTALEKAFAGRASEPFRNFLFVLNEHERLDLIRPIRVAAHELDDEREKRLRVLVQSAVPLPDELQVRLVDGIRQRFQMEPILSITLAPELVGGMKIRIRDLQLDATISSYLDNMKQFFLARSSYEIQSRRDRFSSASGD